MKINSVQVGKPQVFGDKNATQPMEKEWTSGIRKEPVTSPVSVHKTNIEGDAQADLRVHGGPDKAICAYPLEHFVHWKDDLKLDLPSGGFGENFTTQGMLESDVCIGDIYRVGSSLLQVSQPRQPCWKLSRRWKVKDLPARVQKTGKTGWYFRVLEEGTVKSGDSFLLEQRQEGAWTIADANEVMHHQKKDWQAAAKLAAQIGLSENWQSTLLRRASKETIEDSSPRLLGPPPEDD